MARVSSKLVHLVQRTQQTLTTSRDYCGGRENSAKDEPCYTHPAEACDRDEPRGGTAHPVAERQQGHPRCRGRFTASFATWRRRFLEFLAALPSRSPPPPYSVRLLFPSFRLTRLPGEPVRRACRTISSRRSHACANYPRLALPRHRRVFSSDLSLFSSVSASRQSSSGLT